MTVLKCDVCMFNSVFYNYINNETSSHRCVLKCSILSLTVATLMPGMDLSVTTRLTPSPRDVSPALAIALPMMKSVNLVPVQCFDNIAFHNDKTRENLSDNDSKSSSRQGSVESDNTVRVNNYRNERYMEKIEEKTDARTPLLRGHKIESLDETKSRDAKIEKRKSSAST